MSNTNQTETKGLWKNLFDAISALIGKYSNFLEILAFAIISMVAIWAELDTLRIKGYRPDASTFFAISIFGIFLYILAKVTSKKHKKSVQDEFDEYKTSQQQKLKQTIRRYEDTLFSERLQALGECLQELYEALNFNMQERICIYTYRDQDNHFECRSRYSSHPDHTKFSERKKYPGNDGVIGHVWHVGGHNGSLRDNNFPDPHTSQEQYAKYLEDQYNIPEEVASGLRMKSVDLYAEVIRDTKNRAVAVIIFESERKNFLDVNKIENEYNSNIKMRIVDFLGKMQSHDLIGN